MSNKATTTTTTTTTLAVSTTLSGSRQHSGRLNEPANKHDLWGSSGGVARIGQPGCDTRLRDTGKARRTNKILVLSSSSSFSSPAPSVCAPPPPRARPIQLIIAKHHHHACDRQQPPLARSGISFAWPPLAASNGSSPRTNRWLRGAK